MSTSAINALEPSMPGGREWLAGQFEQLKRWFGGRYVVNVRPGEETVAAQSLLDYDRLERLLGDLYASQDYSNAHIGVGAYESDEHLQGIGLGRDRGMSVATSWLTRHYSAPATTVAIVGLASGIGFDLSPAQCTMVLNESGIPFRLMLGAAVRDPAVLAVLDGVTAPANVPRVDSRDQLRTLVWRSLYGENLNPIFLNAARVSKVTPPVMWTNAAEWVAMVGDAASEYLENGIAAPLIAESQALFEAETLPGVDGPNPLRDRIDWVPVENGEAAVTVQTRRLCCMTYLLAVRLGRLCQNCPYLPPEDRLLLRVERHGVPMGTPLRGAAEQRAIEHGRDRPSVSALLKRRDR